MSNLPPNRPGALTAVAAPEPERFRRVRVDQGSGRGRDLAPGRNSLLGSFRFGVRATPAPERRAEPRHDARHIECLAWAGWRVWRGFQMSNALLIDLSRGGARVFLDRLPPHGRAVWLFLETPEHKAVVKARVVQVEPSPTGQCVARVEFQGPCPYALFEAAVCGQTVCDPKARTVPAARAPGFAAPRRSHATAGEW